MKPLECGEWIKGPFANATIEGFITGEEEDSYLVAVKSIEDSIGESPDYLKVGSYFKIPKIVVHEFYRSLNRDQQQNIISLAKHLNNYQWVVDLSYQFYNPFKEVGGTLIPGNNSSGKYIGSNLFNRYLKIDAEERIKLFEYYQQALKGHPNIPIKSPDQITTDVMDSVIAAIVLLYD